jgi:predicted nucleic acid binding AN1-type Zn finger protein
MNRNDDAITPKTPKDAKMSVRAKREVSIKLDGESSSLIDSVDLKRGLR